MPVHRFQGADALEAGVARLERDGNEIVQIALTGVDRWIVLSRPGRPTLEVRPEDVRVGGLHETWGRL